MTNARKDDNGYSVMLATSNVDGSTPTLVKVNESTKGLFVDDGTTGSDLSGNIANRDENYHPVLMGVSSTDGVTPTAIYATSDGRLLIKTT